MKHADHPMNLEEAGSIADGIRAAGENTLDVARRLSGGQVDPSSAHMTDREQWRYYGGKLRMLDEMEHGLSCSSVDTVRASIAAQQQILREVIGHIELRMEAKRNGVDYPSESH